MKRSVIKSRLLLLLILIATPSLMITPSHLYAQVSNEITTEDLRNLSDGKRVPQFRAIETVGTPFLLETFQEGFVTLRNGLSTEPLTMNFNIYQNRVEFKDGNNIYALDGDSLKGFTINNSTRQYKFGKGYSARKLNPNDLVRILTEGKATVLVKYEVGFQQNVATYGTATQKDAYVSREILYVIKDEDVERIRRIRERTILRRFDNYQKEMKNFVEENNLDLTSLEDIKTLFDHYNNLE